VAALVLAVAGAGLTVGTVAGTAVPASAGPVPVVTAGGGHSCALMTDQTVWCWGRNTVGQLGTGTTADSLVPVHASTLGPAIGVSAGHDHTCAVSTANQVWCWGANAFGELGNGTTSVGNPLPVLAQGIVASQVSAGDQFTCAVTLAHTVDCWGDNNYGELGNGTLANSSIPVKVKNLTNVVQVAARYFHACALESSGTIWCWGDNSNGQLGNGSTTASKVPVQVSIQNATSVAAVSAGIFTSCAVTGSLNAACWGWMTGDGSPLMTTHTSAVGVKNLPAGGVSQVSAAYGGCALVRLGGLATGLRCWGDNSWGELGNNTITDSTTPVKVKGLSQVQSVATGGTHTCALVHNGGAWCWGENNWGQLGNGTTNNSSVPVTVTGLPLKQTQIAAADDHTCALLADGTVRCWGLNNVGQLGDGTTNNSSTPVAVAGLTGVVQIALGDAFTCAVTGAGTVECWGDNSSGELGNGSTTNSTSPVQVSGLNGVVAIGAGSSYACATLFTGQVECWGDNSAGQLGDGSIGGISTTPVTVSGFTSNGASIGTFMAGTSCSLNSSQVPECWGANHEGELGDGTTSNSATPVVVQGL